MVKLTKAQQKNHKEAFDVNEHTHTHTHTQTEVFIFPVFLVVLGGRVVCNKKIHSY